VCVRVNPAGRGFCLASWDRGCARCEVHGDAVDEFELPLSVDLCIYISVYLSTIYLLIRHLSFYRCIHQVNPAEGQGGVESYVHTHIYMYIYICMYIYIYICLYIYLYIAIKYSYICIYVCTYRLESPPRRKRGAKRTQTLGRAF